MEKIFIKEEMYQKIKEKLNKKDDYFTLQEITNAILMVKAGVI